MKRYLLYFIAVLALSGNVHALNGDCDRSCLEGFVNQYLDALVASDPARLPLTADARYTENGIELELGDGMWGPVIELGDYRFYFADPDAGQVGFFGSLREHGHPAMLGLRLKIEDRLISEMEAFIIRSTARGTFSAIDELRVAPIFEKALTESQKRPRGELIRIANSYFEGLVNGTDEATPFADNCTRIENGVVTANNPDKDTAMAMWKMTCREQFATGLTKVITGIRERRFPIVDEERGLVYGMVRFDHHGRNKSIVWNDGSVHSVNTPFDEPFSFQIGELFKIQDGRIHHIEALVFPVPYKMPTGWVAGAGPGGRTDVSNRLQRLEDREEIRTLLIKYGRTLDARDFKAFSKLFARDGEWNGGMGAARGPAAIQKLMEDTIGSNSGGGFGPRNFHLFDNEVIEVHGDRATAHSKWTFVMQGEDNRPQWVYLGHYNDILVREGGRWKFLQRKVTGAIPGEQE